MRKDVLGAGVMVQTVTHKETAESLPEVTTLTFLQFKIPNAGHGSPCL